MAMTYSEAGGCCPNTVAFAVEDGGLVEVASADEAIARYVLDAA